MSLLRSVGNILTYGANTDYRNQVRMFTDIPLALMAYHYGAGEEVSSIDHVLAGLRLGITVFEGASHLNQGTEHPEQNVQSITVAPKSSFHPVYRQWAIDDVVHPASLATIAYGIGTLFQ